MKKIQKQGLAIIPHLHIDVVDTKARQGRRKQGICFGFCIINRIGMYKIPLTG